MTSVRDLEDSIFLHESVIRGHHVFKDVWTPHLGEILLVEKEPGNSHDSCAVALLKADRTIQWDTYQESSREYFGII